MDNNPQSAQPISPASQSQPVSGPGPIPPVQPGPAQPAPAPMNGQPMPGPNGPMPGPNTPMGPNSPMPAQPAPGFTPGPNGPAAGLVMQPKQPMDPAKKKKIILISSICGGVLVLGIAAAIIIPILLRVDYSTAYKTAKELKPKIYDINQSYSCEYVEDYVDSTYTTIKTYNEYIAGCKDVYNNGATELVNELGDTAGIKRNSDLKLQFDKFKNEYDTLISGSTEELDQKLSLWQARHSFVVAADELTYSDSSDAEFTTAANYLIESGNDALKTYGEGWLSRSIELAAAYRNYRNAPLSSWTETYNIYSNKRSEFSDWVSANRPDITTIAPLNFSDTYKMYTEFNNLYSMITKTYAANYNSGSGDCNEFMGDVYCE